MHIEPFTSYFEIQYATLFRQIKTFFTSHSWNISIDTE
jgi:hypothetical protein